VGDSALLNSTGTFNTALGFGAGIGVTTANNVICIGANVIGFNVDDSCFIGNIRDAVVAPDAAPVLIDSSGKLGTVNGSSRRFKTDIQRMDKSSESLLGLKPVTFRYKSDAKGIAQFGLIAEEVAEVNADLVVRGEKGEINSVRYDAVNAMLLNEFLKEHRKNEEQGAIIAQQRKDFETAITQLKTEMDALAARLKEQDAKLHKVSARIEMSESAPRFVANEP
jgi:hypothetical protein